MLKIYLWAAAGILYNLAKKQESNSYYVLMQNMNPQISTLQRHFFLILLNEFLWILCPRRWGKDEFIK